MAGRPNKVGLDYFELDCHMDEKVRLIQAEFGLKGFAVVVKLYQKIYGENGYYCEWTDDSLLLFMSENNITSRGDRNLITEIISACIRRGIFSEQLYKKFSILTSAGIQKRYLNAVSKREAVNLKNEYLLICVPTNPECVAVDPISSVRNPINDGGNSQSRVEKSREKESIKNISSELAETSSEQPVITLTLIDGTEYPVCHGDVSGWTGLYPAVDVMQELRKMKGWCDANPKNRKTRAGIKRFINNWLAKQQDRGVKPSSKQSGLEDFINGNG